MVCRGCFVFDLFEFKQRVIFAISTSGIDENFKWAVKDTNVGDKGA